ncbi:MAG: methyltransferase family protein [Candidatus Kariarchaeaceae archaeon]|jgi:protein-S-isoprenylcysteine O-methyltransferase Ste14
MVGSEFVVNFLTLMLILYYAIQFSFDGYTIRKRDTSEKITNHGISETDTGVVLPGISSLIMFILWFSIILSRKLYLGSDQTDYLQHQFPSFIGPLMQLIGMLLILTGVIIANWSRILRGINSPNWGFMQSSKLITNGPYKYIRHPTYTFYFLITLGLAILTQIWLIYFILLGLTGYSKVVSVEEGMLILQFGNEYLEYQSTTKKFIPFIW